MTFSILKTRAFILYVLLTLSDSLKLLNRNLFTITDGENVSLKSIKINNTGNVISVFGYGNSGDDYNIDKYTFYRLIEPPIPLESRSFKIRSMNTKT